MKRVVSLVPSLTEAVAETLPGTLVGATDWCSHPGELDVVRIGGTKNPKVERIIELAPDVVIANEEENRLPDLDALRAAGLDVLVTEVRTVPDAFGELARVLAACGAPGRPGWLREAETAWRALPEPAERRTAVVPIWRRPWMVVGRDTFAGDPISTFKLQGADFSRLGSRLQARGLPSALILEGGYAAAALGENAVCVLEGFET